MNYTLFKASFKSNRILMIVISLVLLMYSSIMIYMFDPENVNLIADMMKLFPEGFGNAFGFNQISTDLTSHIGSYLYGFIFIAFPMIYVIVVANNLVAKHVDRGSMSYLLATPNTRFKIVFTQAIFLISSITLLFVIQVILGILISKAIHNGYLEVWKYIQINIITMLVFYVLSGISFLASCFFNESSKSLSIGISVPMAFLIIKMLSATSSDLEFLKNFSLYTFIDVEKILSSSTYTLNVSLILLAMAIVIYSAAIYIFNKRSLIL
ncbi:MAG: ABC transporter permease subunit [Eubacteriaceae bacterium]